MLTTLNGTTRLVYGCNGVGTEKHKIAILRGWKRFCGWKQTIIVCNKETWSRKIWHICAMRVEVVGGDRSNVGRYRLKTLRFIRSIDKIVNDHLRFMKMIRPLMVTLRPRQFTLFTPLAATMVHSILFLQHKYERHKSWLAFFTGSARQHPHKLELFRFA